MAVVMAVSFRAVRSTMERERARLRPPVPHNIFTLSEMLHNFPLTERIYRGTSVGTDGLIAIVFGNREILQRMNHVHELHMNCMFEAIPVGTRPFRVLVVYIRIEDSPFPILYAVMERTSEPLFTALWEMICRLIPELRNNLATVITGFEKDMIRATATVPPRVHIRSSWFFYRQALLQKWVELALAEAPGEVLLMASALPLVPVVRFMETINLIATIGDRIAGDHPNILQFLFYMRNQWLPLMEIMAVERASLSTSDMCEALNRYLIANLGGPYRNIWRWLDKLVHVLSNNEINWRDARPVSRRNMQWRLRETARISRLQDNLSTGRLNIEEFLMNIMDHSRREEIASYIYTVTEHIDHGTSFEHTWWMNRSSRGHQWTSST